MEKFKNTNYSSDNDSSSESSNQEKNLSIVFSTIKDERMNGKKAKDIIRGGGEGINDVNYRIEEDLAGIGSRYIGKTLLLAACYNHRFDIIKVLLEESADIKLTDKNENGVLHLLIYGINNPNKHFNDDDKDKLEKLIRHLIHRGADPNQKNRINDSGTGKIVEKDIFEILKNDIKIEEKYKSRLKNIIEKAKIEWAEIEKSKNDALLYSNNSYDSHPQFKK